MGHSDPVDSLGHVPDAPVNGLPVGADEAEEEGLGPKSQEHKRNKMPELCFRALLYPKQVHRWNNGVYNSYHPATHPEWQAIWNQKEAAHPGAEHDAAGFSLAFSKGRYSEQAVSNYLHLMRTKGNANWTQDEIDSATELAGVSAFNGPEGPARAYRYAVTSGHPEHLAKIVPFMGDVICELPEDGGVIVNNVMPVAPVMTATEFREHHGVPQYVAAAPDAGEQQEGHPAAGDFIDELEFEDEPMTDIRAGGATEREPD